MSGNLRRQVLGTFKKLHRTRMKTFQDDKYALEATRNKINEEYRKCKDITDENKIAELNEFALAVEREVRTTIVQAREVEPGKFALRVNTDTEKLDNATLDAAGCSTSTQRKPSSDFKKCSDTTNTS